MRSCSFFQYILRNHSKKFTKIQEISMEGVNINNVKHADYTVMVAYSPEKLQELLSVVVQESDKRGFR